MHAGTTPLGEPNILIIKPKSTEVNSDTKSYPQVGLGVILLVVYNVYQVGRSGK